MEKTEKQLLRDSEIPPTDAVIAQGLGNAYKPFARFVEKLNQYGIMLTEWRYYNDATAWLSKGEYKWTTPRGASKVKPIFWLSIWEGFFRTAFFFSGSMQEELLSLPLSTEAKELVRGAKPMGKTMRFLPIVLNVNSELQLNDIYVLAEFRKAKI